MDESASAIITISVLIFGIISVVLFFKIWGACNNIKRIADKYAPKHKEKNIDPDSISEEEAQRLYDKYQRAYKKPEGGSI